MVGQSSMENRRISRSEASTATNAINDLSYLGKVLKVVHKKGIATEQDTLADCYSHYSSV